MTQLENNKINKALSDIFDSVKIYSNKELALKEIKKAIILNNCLRKKTKNLQKIEKLWKKD